MFARQTGRGLLLAFALALVLGAVPAQADRFHVLPDGTRTSGPSTPGDWSAENCYATLAEAAAQATLADSVLCAAGEHQVAGSFDLAVAFVGNAELSSDPAAVTLDLGNTGAFASPVGHQDLRLQGLTLTGGDDQRTTPCLIAQGIALVLDGCVFTGFHAVRDGNAGGAALRLLGLGTVEAYDCEFSANQSSGRGGAIYITSPYEILFERCQLVGNAAINGGDPRGGAIHVNGQFGGSTATFRECELRDNVCGGPGGAATMRNCSTVWEDCIVTGNRTGLEIGWSEGAGLHHNRYPGDGGPVFTAVARRCTFENNKGQPDIELNGGDGGGFYLVGSYDNVAQGLVEDCYFRDNFNIQGAGVYISRYAEGVIRRSRFIENRAYHMGGGAFKGGPSSDNDGETLLIEQSLFVRNEAGYTVDGLPTNDYNRGGAICCRMHPRVIAIHCTFLDNRCSQSSYYFGDAFAHYFEFGLWVPENLCELKNCVFWGTNGVDTQVYSTDGGMAAVANVAIATGELDIGDFTPTDPVTLTVSPFDPAEDGYPLSGGPLIDAALDLGYTSDIDGQPMPVGDAPDIGCFEWHGIVAVNGTPAAEPVSLAVQPNPFNPRTVLSCRLETAAMVELVLYDARGQQVRRLWSGAVGAGERQWTWDGRDEAGRACATGVYLARLVLDGRPAGTHKLTLVR